MSSRGENPFFEEIGKFLGVPPEEIQLRLSKTPGEFTCIGPMPSKLFKEIPELPQFRNYCFTFVIKTGPPPICNAYQQEYEDLQAQLPALIEAEAWSDLAAVAQRLSELEQTIRSICRVTERVITYCIFDYFEDPFAGGRVLPQKPPIPPLVPSK